MPVIDHKTVLKTAHDQEKQVHGCKAPQPGEPCPVCGIENLDYDGLLNLVCPHCGYQAPGGGFT